eukprot:763839-Ditylum_brightwellii.AAC.1
MTEKEEEEKGDTMTTTTTDHEKQLNGSALHKIQSNGSSNKSATPACFKKYYPNLYLYTADAFDKYALIQIVEKALKSPSSSATTVLQQQQQKSSHDSIEIINPAKEEANDNGRNLTNGTTSNKDVKENRLNDIIKNENNNTHPSSATTTITPAVTNAIKKSKKTSSSSKNAEANNNNNNNNKTSKQKTKQQQQQNHRIHADLVRRCYLPSSIIPGVTILKNGVVNGISSATATNTATLSRGKGDGNKEEEEENVTLAVQNGNDKSHAMNGS